MKKHGGGEVDSDKKDCPLSPTDWVMFLGGEINRGEGFRSALITTTMAVCVALVMVMAGSLYAFMNMNTEFALMVAPSLKKFWSFILCVILGLIIFEIVILVITKKKVKALEEILEDIIDGENDSNKIRERWEEIAMFERKRNGKKHAFSTRTRLFIGLIIGLIFVALLIAIAMLVESLLIKFVLLILLIPIFFAVFSILRNKLEKNEKAVVGQRFGDAIIGIISGLFASFIMWLLVTFNETPINRVLALGFALIFLFIFIFVVLIWVCIEILASSTK